MKVERAADTFYNKKIDELAKKKTKNWIDLQINFNNSLFLDFIIFSRKE